MIRLSLAFLIIVFFSINTLAQSYSKYIADGKTFYNKTEYLTALERFDLAYEFAKTNEQKTVCRTWKNKCKKEIKVQQLKIQRILTALLPKGVKNIYTHFKSIGDKHFALGEYKEALKNYQLAFDSPGKPQKNTAKQDVENTKKCQKWQKAALDYINNENYELAEQEILKVLKINPKSRNDIVIASAINPIHGMVLVQGGSFIMGNPDSTLEYSESERPVHQVELESFKIACYEATNLQYAVFLNRYGSDKVLSGEFEGKKMIYEHQWGLLKNTSTGKWIAQKGYEFHPVIYVTWFGANTYCNYFNLSLPSESQWEYAAQGGALQILKKLIGTDSLKKIAWYKETTGKTSTFKVGLLASNELGVFDMSGNVWEWCMDNWSENYKNAPHDGSALIDENSNWRAYRGGSWSSSAIYCRTTYRYREGSHIASPNLGFRPIYLNKNLD